MIFLKIWEITALPVAPNFQMFTYKSLNKLEHWMLLPFGINTTALNSTGTHANTCSPLNMHPMMHQNSTNIVEEKASPLLC